MVIPRTEGVKGIVLHNTANYKMSAQELYDYLANECKTSQGTHYICDHENVLQVAPDDWAIYSSGKGNDYCARHLIAIEICDNLNDDLYKQGQDKAIELIKELKEKYHLSNDDIFFHNDFNSTMYCPHILLDKYKSARNFCIEELEE